MTMNKMRKIGLMGVQGSGKTTTTYGIVAELKRMNYNVHVVQEAARKAAAQGVPINSATNISTQMWILAHQMQSEIEAEAYNADFTITDRTVVDNLAYNHAYMSHQLYISMKTIALSYIMEKPYDLIFVFNSLDAGPAHDGIRDSSREAQELIVKAFDWVLEDINLPEVLLYRVKGKTKGERLIECMAEIKSRFILNTVDPRGLFS